MKKKYQLFNLMGLLSGIISVVLCVILTSMTLSLIPETWVAIGFVTHACASLSMLITAYLIKEDL